MRLPFFLWRDEGEDIQQGLNVYPLGSPYHVGGYLVIGRLRLYARWSKLHRRLHWDIRIVPKGLDRLPRSRWGTGS